jgi:hypothetical protein
MHAYQHKEQTMKRWHTFSAGIILALLALGLFGWGLSRSAAATPQATVSAGDIVVPMGPAQPAVRTAYHDVLAHLYNCGELLNKSTKIIRLC